MRGMRIALVSPYSWSYPGGVTRHIEALAERFIEDGHYVRVLAPFDPPGRFSAGLHRGAHTLGGCRADERQSQQERTDFHCFADAPTQRGDYSD